MIEQIQARDGHTVRRRRHPESQHAPAERYSGSTPQTFENDMRTFVRTHGANAAGASGAADAQSAASGLNEFGWDLYRNVAGHQKGNFFFSGYSIGSALSQVAVGARGETAEAMGRVLHHDLPADRQHGALGDVEASLQSRESATRTLRISNRLWTQKGLKLEKPFASTLKDAYRSSAATLNFSGDPEGARTSINKQVEVDTTPKGGKEGLIKDLVPKGVITPLTSLVVTNCIYFKDNWAAQFDKANTTKEAFRAPGGVKGVPTMHQTGTFKYGQAAIGGADVQVLEMPYEGKDMSMVFLLPTEDRDLARLERGLSESAVSSALEQAHEQKVAVAIPKFKMESSFKMKEPLKELGMEVAFSPNSDFSGITRDHELQISEVVHKAVVEVNEEGAEMAAATAVVVAKRSAVSRPESFIADHPFVFLIRDNQTGAILGAGRVSDPA